MQLPAAWHTCQPCSSSFGGAGSRPVPENIPLCMRRKNLSCGVSSLLCGCVRVLRKNVVALYQVDVKGLQVCQRKNLSCIATAVTNRDVLMEGIISAPDFSLSFAFCRRCW